MSKKMNAEDKAAHEKAAKYQKEQKLSLDSAKKLIDILIMEREEARNQLAYTRKNYGKLYDDNKLMRDALEQLSINCCPSSWPIARKALDKVSK